MEKKVKVPKLRFPGFTEDWEQRKLGEVTLKIGSGKTPHGGASTYVNDGIPLIRSQNIVNDRVDLSEVVCITDEVDAEMQNSRVNTNDVLLNITGASIGRSAVYSGIEPANVNQHVCIIRPEGLFSGDFIQLQLASANGQNQIDTNQAGGAREGLNFQQIAKMEFSFPKIDEQRRISAFFVQVNTIITLHQRKLTHLQAKKKSLLQKMFPKKGERFPELRFPGFTDAWEQCKLGEVFERVNERNDGSFDKTKWISVAKMFFQVPEKVQSNNLDTRTYVMREGDIAFEGHPNKEFQFGRFVANDIGAGVVSELFPIYRHIDEYDSYYWKYAIQLEWIMAPIFAKAITSSGNSSNKLDTNHFLRQSIRVPNLAEQKKIGECFSSLDHLITLHQRKLAHLQTQKKALLQQMFV